MLNPVEFAPGEPRERPGDAASLARQVGSTEVLSALATAGSAQPLGAVKSLGALRDFLRRYQRQILVPLELPAIYRAYRHASRFEVRELVALDQSLAGEKQLQPFSAASRRVGCHQLRRLRPLRDQRLIQRYGQAIERGEAGGWHTLVYGLTLALYSLPARQGLLHYGRQALAGFIGAAARSLALTEAESQRLTLELSADLPGAVDALLRAGAPADFALV